MSDTPAPARPPAWKPLSPRQRRVLGVLIEKAKTVPASYPMTVNAIVSGCNQKSNREPPMTLDDFDVEKVLDELRTMGAVSEIDWMGRAAKYKHHAYEWLGVSKPEIAVVAELLLRGEQSVGDLRARAARMEPIPDLGALRPIVDGLMARGLMIALTPAGRGQIVSHNLYPAEELQQLRARYGGGAHHAAPDDEASAQSPPAMPDTGASAPSSPAPDLHVELGRLREELDRLRARVDALEASLRPRD